MQQHRLIMRDETKRRCQLTGEVHCAFADERKGQVDDFTHFVIAVIEGVDYGDCIETALLGA